MSGFQLDTSGVVDMRGPYNDDVTLCWSDLTPFAQGYVGAMLQEVTTSLQPEFRPFAFSDLAPATLSRIIEDCERFSFGSTRLGGASLWRMSSSGNLASFPPRKPYRGDDGLIYFREAGQ